jgi:hypothetical protein
MDLKISVSSYLNIRCQQQQWHKSIRENWAGALNAEPVFLNVYGDQESMPRNEFRQPM